MTARLVAFAALGTFAAAHWAGLVADPPIGRVAAVVLVATLGGAILSLTADLRGPRAPLAGRLLRPAVALVTTLGSLVAMGLPVRLLPPGRWDELADDLDRGLSGVSLVDWPYAGPDEWVRLAILLGAPVVVAVASAFAFWPARSERTRLGLRVAALALLVGLYGVAATEHKFGGELARGVVLFLLIAGWLWLPRVRRREATAAAAALAGAAILALPAAAKLEDGRAWIDYRGWQWFEGRGESTFSWGHQYGPLDFWRRKGTTVLQVRSPRRYYWKAATLDAFDGLFWYASGENVKRRSSAELPEPDERKTEWYERIRFTVRNFQSNLIVGAGTPLGIRGVPAHPTSDGTAEVTRRKLLGKGDTYSILTYIPRPTAEEMRAAVASGDEAITRYTALALPRPEENAHNVEAASAPWVPRAGSSPVSLVRPPRPTAEERRRMRDPEEGRADRSFFRNARAIYAEARRQVLASPYAEVYRLARQLAEDQETTYDVVKRTEEWLRRNGGYRYDERVPTPRYPLAGFLLDDKRGYCQQFSGAMALLLRMNGIPARVAAGFATGSWNRATGEYRVRDYDAHSWVEVHFGGIGWVTFDPTPPVGQAEQAPSSQDLGATAGPRGGAETDGEGAAAAPERVGRQRAGAESAGDAVSLLTVATIVAGAGLVGLLAAWLQALFARRRRDGDEADLLELERALARLGYAVPAGSTLLALEGRLARVAGPAAARYLRLLRERRFAPGGARRPDRRDRRDLRRALTAKAGPIARLRGFVALPWVPRRFSPGRF